MLLLQSKPDEMDPECSHSACDIYDVASSVPYDTNENKTERSPRGEKGNATPMDTGRQPIDDIEREDFDEENRILKHCPGMVVDGKLRYAPSLATDVASTSGGSTLTPGSEPASDFHLAGCSREPDAEPEDEDIASTAAVDHDYIANDSNTTIKNMIRNPRRPYTLPTSSPIKEDFMQKLLNSNIEEKKHFPKGKLYKAEAMEGVDCELSEASEIDLGGPSGRTSSNASSIGSISSDSASVPSTSNADRLLGLGDVRFSDPRPSVEVSIIE